MTPQVISLSSATSSAWIPVDYKQNPFNISLAVVLSNTPSLTCKVEYTLDDVFNSTITPTAFTVGSMDSITANATGSIITPVKAIRLNITSWTSGTATLTALQGVVDSTGWQSTDNLLDTHIKEHGEIGGILIRYKPTVSSIYTRRQLVAERSTRATYHATFLASGDFYAVSPIIAVTREPTDATYTNDDVYDAIAVAPTNAILTGGLPNASGGDSSWTVSANQVFARQVGASTTSPVLVTGTPIICKSIPRTDGGPGRLAMTRMWSLGSIHAQAATTRMPTTDDSPVGTLANNQLWDTEFPLAGVGQYYYKNSTDHASINQGTFGALATRWATTCIIGAKFYYSKPSITVLGIGDSLIGGDYNEAGHPTRCSYGWRASYKLMLEGRQIDYINAGFSGYRWDQFGPVLQKLVAQIKPDIILMPIHTGNGVTAGVGVGYTTADANLHVATAMSYVEWALNNGVKEVILVTPMPSTTPNYNAMYDYLTTIVENSRFPYFNTMDVVANSDLTWKTGYSIDGGHPTALANEALSDALISILRPYTMTP